jgi:hypothetical protein
VLKSRLLELIGDDAEIQRDLHAVRMAQVGGSNNAVTFQVWT